MKIADIEKGDIVFYRNGKTNLVRRPKKYRKYYDEDFKNVEIPDNYDIMKIKRYVKFLCFYRLKTIYKRKDS